MSSEQGMIEQIRTQYEEVRGFMGNGMEWNGNGMGESVEVAICMQMKKIARNDTTRRQNGRDIAYHQNV